MGLIRPGCAAEDVILFGGGVKEISRIASNMQILSGM